MPNRYDKLNEFYKLAFKNFSKAVFDCYKSVDRNHGNYNLYNLNCEEIINKVFVHIFGESINESVNENPVAAPEEPATNSADENTFVKKTEAKINLKQSDLRTLMLKMTERKN